MMASDLIDGGVNRGSHHLDTVAAVAAVRLAKTWKVERRLIARVEAGSLGANSRFIVTNLPGLPKTLYEKVYCGRGQAENPGLRRGRLI